MKQWNIERTRRGVIFRLFSTWLLLTCSTLAIAIPTADKGVVIIVVEFSDGPTDIGTGFFIDHDGLIATADHVVRGLSIVGDGTSAPTQTKHPKRITIYSAALGKTFVLNVTSVNNSITTGNIAPGKWVDLALLRVNLDDATRKLLVPLDVLVDPVVQGSTLWAYGPSCTNTTDANCLQNLQPVVLRADIMNPIERARSYTTNAIATPGYSGGPLVDDVGRVAGVGSQLVSIGLSDFGGRAIYIPAAYLIHLKIPPSAFFSDSAVCSKIGDFQTLTVFDINELSPSWNSAALTDAQCNCCCNSLSRAPQGLLTTRMSSNSCAPPFCPTQRIFGVLRTISLAAHDPESSTADLAEAARNARAVYSELTAQAVSIPTNTHAELFRALGGVVSQLSQAETKHEFPTGSLSEMDSLALMAFWKSQKLQESPAVYQAMKPLFDNEGLTDLGTKVSILAEYSEKRQLHKDEAERLLKEQNLDPGQLRNAIAGGIGTKTPN